jgi:sulfur carrier protein
MNAAIKPTVIKPTVTLTVNGLPRESDAATLAELWQRETEGLEAASPRGFAISLNGVVVRRAAWPATRLADGDTVEIIRAMSGG